MTIAELIYQFRDAAIDKAGAVDGEEDALLYRRMANAFHGLYEHGDAGWEAFRQLLHDESAHVRCWVAAQLFCERNEEARAVLHSLCKFPGAIGFDAKMVLREDKAGRLEPPFKSRGA